MAQSINDTIGTDQFAYKEGHNTIMPSTQCQHMSLKWLENGAKYVRVFSFDFRKAFDSVPHDILCGKFKSLPLKPYIINWIINFLQDRYQRVAEFKQTMWKLTEEFRSVLGPVLFSIMINDITPANPENELVKFADT